jgi:hypothetical protein
VVVHGSIPDFVPYATAPSRGWHNVPALGELVFHGLEVVAGGRGLLVAQMLAVGVAFAVLGLDARRAGAADGSIVVVLCLLIPATLASLVDIRSQLFSLALFPVLVALLRMEAVRPSRRIWLLVPLVAVWSNLHGAVLVGLAVAAAYLVLERARREPAVAAAVLAVSIAALFATPALWSTGDYYHGVLQNEAAKRGVGLWTPLTLTNGLDVAFVVVGVALAILALRARPALWELVALAGTLALAVHVARGGVWFAFLVATPAAVGLRRGEPAPARTALPAVALLAVLAVVGIAQGPRPHGASAAVLGRALAAAHGAPILAADQLAEQVALAGGRIVIGNPIDAFRSPDQKLYLDWLAGKPAGDRQLAGVGVVLAEPGSAAARRMAANPAFRRAARSAHAVLYVRGRRSTLRPSSR